MLWATDPVLFASLPGGPELQAWFGFVPRFHDAVLDRVEIGGDTVTLTLKAFRMTPEIDAAGYFVLDRHATVSIHLAGVMGLKLAGGASSIVSDLGIRRVGSAPPDWDLCTAAPGADDYEIVFDTSWGMEGAILAREVRLSVSPAPA